MREEERRVYECIKALFGKDGPDDWLIYKPETRRIERASFLGDPDRGINIVAEDASLANMS